MVIWASLTVHFLIVIEKVWIDLIQEPLLFCYSLLHRHKKRTGDPVNESTCWPLVSERQMEKLEHLEERSEPIDEPMFIFFCNSTLEKKLKKKDEWLRRKK